jgi:hypothetical protein
MIDGEQVLVVSFGLRGLQNDVRDDLNAQAYIRRFLRRKKELEHELTA